MEIPERKLIKILRNFEKKDINVLRGIGDDCAIVKLSGKPYALCQDAIVEEIHFSLSYMSPYQIGKKAIYANIADILSMGAMPLYYQVTLGIPERIMSDVIRGIYRGMSYVAKEFGLSLLGGDTVSTLNDFFIDVSMVGEVVWGDYKGRNQAKENDLIGVTGFLGESAYGLKIMKEGIKKKRGIKRFVKRYLNPRPPFEIWMEIMKNDITNAMMDVSDGLLLDLERMMEESGKCGVIYYEKLPIPEILKKEKLDDYALWGGEDYQFLFTFPRNKLELINILKSKGLIISVIGEVTSGRGIKVIKDGKEVKYNKVGYEHFSRE
ncbi:MAG: thiamine-phosphate kinase [Deltaproteobacteria bacterium]|nr:thiamine-phosphate kinase [Deltaproteobacteria bacterium]